METKHSEEPWNIISNDGWHSSPILIESKGEVIATISPIGSVPEQMANAKLFAAAPDLLQALKDCVERMEELQKHTNYPLAWPRVQAMEAIKKATI